MTEPARAAAASKVCRKCERELPIEAEYFRPTSGVFGSGFRNICRRCEVAANAERNRTAYAALKVAKEQKAPGKFVPRIVGDGGGMDGGYTVWHEDGMRWAFVSDVHGHRKDPAAIAAACAGLRYYRPHLVILGGDFVDFTALSRFHKSPDEVCSVPDDLEACNAAIKEFREAAPDAEMEFLPGNHDVRLQRFLWSNAAALWKLKGLQLENALELRENNVKYNELGKRWVTPNFLAKHGNVVRSRAGNSAQGEMDKNGVSGVSGHTHRGNVYRKRIATGELVWIESGCLCGLDPSYSDGQTMDWTQGITYGSVNQSDKSCWAEFAKIDNGRIRFGDKQVSA